jgi:hypothetical protein
MRYEWDEEKRKSNLKHHGLDFAEVAAVFAGLTATYEDDRVHYAEQRFVTLGLLRGAPVSIIHTESPDLMRIISFRAATLYETQFLFENIASQLPPSPPVAAPRPRKAHYGASGTRPKSRHARRRKKGPQAGPA